MGWFGYGYGYGMGWSGTGRLEMDLSLSVGAPFSGKPTPKPPSEQTAGSLQIVLKVDRANIVFRSSPYLTPAPEIVLILIPQVNRLVLQRYLWLGFCYNPRSIVCSCLEPFFLSLVL